MLWGGCCATWKHFVNKLSNQDGKGLPGEQTVIQATKIKDILRARDFKFPSQVPFSVKPLKLHQ